MEKLRVATALACTRESESNLDYALVDPAFLLTIGVNVANIAGKTPDDFVNGLHRDLTQLTAEQVYKIALHIHSCQDIHRVFPQVFIPKVRSAIEKGELDFSRIKLKNKDDFNPGLLQERTDEDSSATPQESSTPPPPQAKETLAEQSALPEQRTGQDSADANFWLSLLRKCGRLLRLKK